jgi:hypothetical protein
MEELEDQLLLKKVFQANSQQQEKLLQAQLVVVQLLKL